MNMKMTRLIRYNFINRFVFGLEVAAISDRSDIYQHFVSQHVTDPDERSFLLEHIRSYRCAMNRAVAHYMYQQRPQESRRSRLVPTLQICVLRVLMHEFNLYDVCPPPHMCFYKSIDKLIPLLLNKYCKYIFVMFFIIFSCIKNVQLFGRAMVRRH